MRLFALATLLCIASTTAFAHIRYCPPDAGRTIVSLPATTETATITAPDWIDAQVTTGLEVESNKPVSIIIIRHASTTIYRTGKVIARFASQTIEIEVFQAAPLSFVRNGNEIITHDATEKEMRKAWFVPEDGEVVPDLIYAATKDDGIIVAVPPRKGCLFIETVRGIYAARL